MDPEFITPFIKAIQNVFSMMLQLDVHVAEPHVIDNDRATHDVSGIIGLSGDVTGSVVISFPTETAEAVVSLFTGMEMKVDDDDFTDAVGELVNMVSGNAKGDFGGRKVSISCPSVVVGSNHSIGRPRDIPCVAIPCETDCGDLVIEVTIQDQSGSQQVGTASDASAA